MGMTINNPTSQEVIEAKAIRKSIEDYRNKYGVNPLDPHFHVHNVQLRVAAQVLAASKAKAVNEVAYFNGRGVPRPATFH